MSQPQRQVNRIPTVLIILAFLVTACSSNPSDPADSTQPSTAEANIADTPVGSELEWVIDTLGADSGPTAQEAEARFTPEFLAQVPPGQVANSFEQLRPLAPYTVDTYDGTDTQATAVAIASDQSRWKIDIALSEGRIDLLTLQPSQEPPEVTSWEELDSALAGTGAEVSVYAAQHRDGNWQVIHASGTEEPAPLGSVFKLYVLGAAQEAVLDGTVTWDDALTVTDEVRSLPTGELQDRPSGTTVTVAEAAEKMISISDNTATDMLIQLVGRQAVEEAAEAMGHHDPALMQPLLTTKELFRLGWTDPDLRERYSEADRNTRREILAELSDDPLELEDVTITEPVWSQGIDWLATGADIVRAHLELQSMATQDPTSPVRDVMSANPGVAIDTASWPYVGFKGGSGPGVLALSWYLESNDGTPFGLVVQLAAQDVLATADVDFVANIASQGMDLLVEE